MAGHLSTYLSVFSKTYRDADHQVVGRFQQNLVEVNQAYANIGIIRGLLSRLLALICSILITLIAYLAFALFILPWKAVCAFRDPQYYDWDERDKIPNSLLAFFPIVIATWLSGLTKGWYDFSHSIATGFEYSFKSITTYIDMLFRSRALAFAFIVIGIPLVVVSFLLPAAPLLINTLTLFGITPATSVLLTVGALTFLCIAPPLGLLALAWKYGLTPTPFRTQTNVVEDLASRAEISSLIQQAISSDPQHTNTEHVNYPYGVKPFTGTSYKLDGTVVTEAERQARANGSPRATHSITNTWISDGSNARNEQARPSHLNSLGVH